MILRTRSSVKISTGDTPSKSTSEENITMSMSTPSTPTSGSSINGIKIPGGSKLWRYLLYLIIFALIIYILMYDSFSTENENLSIAASSSVKRQLTIVMNTFKRPDLLKDAINHYSKCHVVKHIHVVWSEKDPPPTKLLHTYQNHDLPSIHFDIHVNDSLNNRFKPLPAPYTNGIFSVDDDMRVPCHELAIAYDVWRGSQESIVGFMPRVHIRRNGKLTYRCWWRVWFEGSYSIILTKAAILHHHFFQDYFTKLPAPIFQLIDSSRNCEDIAMQFLIANLTGLPPIYVKGHLEDKGALNGISTSQNFVKAGHMRERDWCLNQLVKAFGRNPLVKSRFFVDVAANRWTNAPSTWFEYISSDLWKW